MVEVNLKAPNAYPPLKSKSPEELFDFAVEMSRSLGSVKVTTPTSDNPDEQDSVVLDSRLMQKKGVQVF